MAAVTRTLRFAVGHIFRQTQVTGHSHIRALFGDQGHSAKHGSRSVSSLAGASDVLSALGIKLDAIRQGLRTFSTSFFQAPGRMNVFDEHPFKVILDYGHNPAAVEAMTHQLAAVGNPSSLHASGRHARRAWHGG